MAAIRVAVFNLPLAVKVLTGTGAPGLMVLAGVGVLVAGAYAVGRRRPR